jgi:pSer/pThr/pTyr-binding forkhead associated (FHA) protein
VSDISVSRMHAFIKYDEGNFLILDNNSKFGTLIKAKNNLPASWDKIAVQVGRTVITFVLKNRESGKEKSKTISNFSSLSNIKIMK